MLFERALATNSMTKIQNCDIQMRFQQMNTKQHSVCGVLGIMTMTCVLSSSKHQLPTALFERALAAEAAKALRDCCLQAWCIEGRACIAPRCAEMSYVSELTHASTLDAGLGLAAC